MTPEKHFFAGQNRVVWISGRGWARRARAVRAERKWKKYVNTYKFVILATKPVLRRHEFCESRELADILHLCHIVVNRSADRLLKIVVSCWKLPALLSSTALQWNNVQIVIQLFVVFQCYQCVFSINQWQLSTTVVSWPLVGHLRKRWV